MSVAGQVGGTRRPAPIPVGWVRCGVAEELARALAGRPVVDGAAAPPVEDIEGKHGAKLDRMLRGLGD